mmetsp:Transcript_6702/g.13753  ORF Transcript_6702/g.13753 Transcript_6702/m.13753 type:complete len:145 (+) Transcript_6702:32-466(+)
MDDHHSHHERVGPLNDGSLAYRLEDYMTSSSFLRELNDFVNKHVAKFEDVEGGEHPHEWFAIYREYELMLGKRMDAFLASESVTAEQAVAACRAAQAQDRKSYTFFEYLAAAVEYTSFYQMMLDFKAHKRDVSSWWNCLLTHEV